MFAMSTLDIRFLHFDGNSLIMCECAKVILEIAVRKDNKAIERLKYIYLYIEPI